MIATLLLLINSVRSEPLQVDPFLTKLAETRCEEMREWSHESWRWNTARKMTKKYFFAGENLAKSFNDATSTFYALENSPTHKWNNHAEIYQKVGLANCVNKLGTTTVILFAGN